ncbi:MAG: hypothetical protein US95_C0006G0006 [Candidatus Woesebacteria bacterium GW2011_GWB1_38_5]|uniref:Uncharacterized protein n=3 Tax=Candidatus Woeseibacteriota TaxID=1752722 RepID=A0A0G0MNP2_9BACT|nr:MAG: hypothetical protein US67_C0050G0010 [Candidatus Woesebacteria bacterium GW2011_GWD1_38_10]KKQ75284.1 MAG: hypothetical protein US95_C0006G0006 [Candidatus Woesebacteria bacterium GW2011_GWB1_38_5]KKQ83939.1 MAG: hypothetical protein UT06_C0012G0004 [Candidatus Woesebacteria bacterium GW2011_GWA1_38_8]
MSLIENKNGKYPLMQNPGVPMVFDAPPTPAKHVLIINDAVKIDPNGFNEKVMLYSDSVQKPSEEDEKQVLAETTFQVHPAGVKIKVI